jgi:WD40 repeat protein/mono/diheme cytochrome c family protein
MVMPRVVLVCLVVVLAGVRAGAGETAGDATVGPAMRVLKENCVSCHNPAKKKGGFVLTSRELALKGGEDGPGLIVGSSAKSPMIMALDSSADPHMPPKGQLSEQEIATLAKWIDAGAKWDAVALAATRPAAATRPIVLRALPASYRPVLSMAISPDGKRLAVGRGDQINLYDLTAADHALTVQLSTPRDVVQSLAWSGDGRLLASGGFRNIRLWDVTSGKQAAHIKGLTGRVTSLAFIPNQPMLTAGEGEVASTGIVHVWHVPDGAAVANWPAHDDSILAMKVSPDGKWLATASADKLVKIWDLATRKEIGRLEGHSAPVMALAVSKDGVSLASAGTDKEIKIWKVATKEQTVALQTNPAGVTDLVWVDEKHLLSSSEDGVARLSSEANKDRAERVFNGAPDVLYCAAATPDGKTLFAGCHDGNVYLWNAASGKLEGTLPLTVAPHPATRPATQPVKPQK